MSDETTIQSVPFSVTLAGPLTECQVFIEAMEAFMPGLVSYNKGYSRGAMAGSVRSAILVIQFWRSPPAVVDQADLFHDSELEWCIFHDMHSYMNQFAQKSDVSFVRGRVPTPKLRRIKQVKLFE